MNDTKLSRRSLALSLLGFAGLALAPTQAQAQGKPGASAEPLMVPMEPGQSGSDPFTETFADMMLRDAQIEQEMQQGLRPRPEFPIAIFNVFEEKQEELMDAWFGAWFQPRGFPGSGQYRFPAPPYRGRIDSQGHFVPGSAPPAAPGLRGPQTASTAFDGPNINVSGFIPPDTQGAVGPNHVMFQVNGRVAIHNKTTGAQISSVSLSSFYAVTVGAINYPQGGAFDPRVVYDRPSGRWFATGMEFGVNNAQNGVILAVSRTNDPTGTWDKYFINIGAAADVSGTYFTDYSTLGVDANGVYFCCRIFPNQVAGTNRAKFAATDKASLIAGAPSLGTVFFTDNVVDMFSTPQPAHNLDNSASGRTWFVASFNSTLIALRSLTWSAGTPSLQASSTLVTTPTSGAPPNAPASGSTTNINTGDFRSQMAMIRGNRLWTARTVGLDATGASTTINRAGCDWMEINVSTATPTIVQSGRVFDPAAATPRYYFYPSIAISGQGHAAMGFSGVTSAESVGIYTCGRLATDAAGTMQAILQTQAGTGAYTRNDGNGRNRWGDYSYTCVDPSDDQTMWIFQEYCSAANTWTVRAQRLLAPAPTASATAVNAIPGQTNVSLPVTGTNLFDPGASFTNRLAASASGSGVTNVRIAYVSPTQASVTFDVSNTATAGLRNVTLTNPDGQTVTINNAINVVAAQPVLGFSRVITNTGSAWRVALTITNTGGSSATSVRVLTSRLGSTNTSTATPISVGTIAAGASAVVNIDFPLASATSGTPVVHRVTGDYTGNTFSSAARVTPP